MAATAFDVLLKEIEDKRESIGRAVIDGAAKDFAEYKSMTGEIRGLSLAHSYITDLVRRMEHEDE
jgi:hypothetical protein